MARAYLLFDKSTHDCLVRPLAQPSAAILLRPIRPLNTVPLKTVSFTVPLRGCLLHFYEFLVNIDVKSRDPPIDRAVILFCFYFSRMIGHFCRVTLHICVVEGESSHLLGNDTRVLVKRARPCLLPASSTSLYPTLKD